MTARGRVLLGEAAAWADRCTATMSGENPSVSILSGDEVKKVFGQDEIDRLAKEAGVQPDEYADQVSRKLPGEIDKATPQGSIPSVEKAATGAFSR